MHVDTNSDGAAIYRNLTAFASLVWISASCWEGLPLYGDRRLKLPKKLTN